MILISIMSTEHKTETILYFHNREETENPFIRFWVNIQTEEKLVLMTKWNRKQKVKTKQHFLQEN